MIRVVARNEGQLVELQEEFPHIQIVPGDIASEYVAAKACDGITKIFHLAAFKHVGLAEQNARECVESNVVGTLNILHQTLIHRPGFIIGISTDKAAQVHGVYGATKLLQERLFADYERLNPDTKYRTVRYGNVLYSTGSVLCKWKARILRGEEVVITDPNATRFYWTVDQAVDLIFECLRTAESSRPYVPKMKAIRLGDLLEAMTLKYAKGEQRVRTIGLQPGESLHEVIEDNGPTSAEVARYTIPEIMELV
jgi:FlaA1/EpsC-like NDP-sugar epimerase